MFETWTHLSLQQYWWVIVSLLGALLVFLMFVQGGQTLIFTLAKTDKERSLLINSLGRKWEFTFTTLVTFGGAFFASFPLFYSTSFGGAYWVWMLILAAFVIQAISYEFRSKAGNLLGARTYEIFLLLNGLLGTLLVGTAVATFFTGSQFYVSEVNFSEWKGAANGLELAFDFTKFTTFINLSLGLAVFFLARVLGILYFLNNIRHDTIAERCKKHLQVNAALFLLFFLFFLVNILIREGFAYDPVSGKVYMEPYKYFNNLIEMPLVLILLLTGVEMTLWGIAKPLRRGVAHGRKSIWWSGPGVVLVVLSLFLVAGLNNTAFYPSVYDLQSSLTIQKASSSEFTLTVMSYVSLLVPFVLAYIWWAWKAINNKQMEETELEEESHIY